MTVTIPSRQRAGIPAGGQFAGRNRADSSVTLTGSYPASITPTEDQYGRAEQEARRQLSMTLATAAELDDRIDALAFRFAEQEAGWTAYQNGETHPDDQYFTAIWAGDAPGFSETYISQELHQSRALRAALDVGTVDADAVAVAGRGNAGNDSTEVRQYLEERIDTYARALICSGRNLSVNQAAALAARRLSEVQPPF
jgi:hypothetical protein